MSLKVIVLDQETGDAESLEVPTRDYLLICTDPCFLHAQACCNGTHLLTIKGCNGARRAVNVRKERWGELTR